jgi:dTDP-4-dehydrorhamnose 3,5-epimerase
MLDIVETAIPDVKIVVTNAFGDDRGYFTELFNERSFAEFGLWHDFVQDSFSMSRSRHTLRGMHFQIPPMAQVKLVRCLAGAILDVVVDIRHGSPTFGAHVAVELTAINRKQLLVPVGFAHGFLTLTDGAEVTYKQSNYYSPDHERTLAFDGAGVDWEIDLATATIAEKDRGRPPLDALPIYFRCDPE